MARGMSEPTPAEPLSASELAELRAGIDRIFRDYVPTGEDRTIRRLLTTLDVERAAARETPAGLDEEDWAAIRGCVAACAGDHREPERYREWYAEVLVKIDRLAAALATAYPAVKA